MPIAGVISRTTEFPLIDNSIAITPKQQRTYCARLHTLAECLLHPDSNSNYASGNGPNSPWGRRSVQLDPDPISVNRISAEMVHSRGERGRSAAWTLRPQPFGERTSAAPAARDG